MKTCPQVFKNEPVQFFPDQATWSDWLEKNHSLESGLWICYAKKNSGISSLTYPQALEVALCWGWIDGQVATWNELYYLQRFTKRRPRSRWSKINRAKAEALIATGKMQAPGLNMVQSAMADGRWDAAYDSPSTLRTPTEIQSRLKTAGLDKKFAALPGQRRYLLISRYVDAKTDKTREKILNMIFEELENPARRGNRVRKAQG